MLDHISVASLRGNLSFLASDLLEGRDTPSRGLDIAAEFIADQFRRAGLEPSFQTATVIRAKADAQELSLVDGETRITAERSDLRARAAAPVMLADLPVYKIDLAAKVELSALKDRVVLFELGAGQWDAADRIWPKLMRSGAAAILVAGEPGRSLVEPDLFVPAAEPAVPAVSVTTATFSELCGRLKPGLTAARASLRISISSRSEGTAKNVFAILRGSDPVLRDSCVVLSAHYDHLGLKSFGTGHRVYNGADDDGSGTVSVLEIAAALAAMPAPPRRSIVFVTFFGEEEGLYGSKYFARNLPCPAEKTVAAINIEQVGRTDTDHGPMPNTVAFIAPSFTSVPSEFSAAAERTGITLPAKPALGDDFFERSDNLSLAEEGIPAHTVAIPAMFADYHGVGDTWEKIDYPNMAGIDRMLALGLIQLANDTQAPTWAPGVSATADFAAAWRSLHPSQSTAGRP